MPAKTVWLIMMDNCLPEHGPHNRHFWFAKHLKERGYNPVVFVASRERGNALQMIEDDAPFKVDDSYGFPFVYIRIKDYGESMKKRVLAIFEFHKRLNKYADTFAEMYGRPDVILGSNGYPLSPWLANRFAKKYKAASICEVCDMWPLALEEYDVIKRGGMIARVLYMVERKNYEQADAIVFSMEGGAEYLCDKGLDIKSGGSISLDKVHYINNGVELSVYDHNAAAYSYSLDCAGDEARKIVYTGSVRAVNDISSLVDVAALMTKDPVKFYIVGGGDKLQEVRDKARSLGLENICFVGPVEKKLIPSILAQADLVLVHQRADTLVAKYGGSQNKLFDYLASGTPILSNVPSSYSVIEAEGCGSELPLPTALDYAERLRFMLADDDRLADWASNARRAAQKYSFAVLTEQLIEIIERV